ncbi:hypothetical protein BABINDRAFT_162740 [Babjeviella inositovora NRRL Y-12698]|uniref:Rap-GAP domain-containing protein n=1 Tax=Babjeviella inositovora NRRL Y-12698 TaxID=984486 RepID=A0A1E3QLG9_9ASCO|nr:uncharacterized protein BABINDRAFT_162740 [Babjeviella inositovora NRRL Y-12698]ODQ78533.1 hypothetical protein BABINDRAFT_162740 [Babjeviella inositovora NRRL Y-12698]
MASRPPQKPTESLGGFSGVFKSFTKSLKPAVPRPEPTRPDARSPINPTVIGGGTEQTKFFLQLGAGNSLSQRNKAVLGFTAILRHQVVSTIPEIWYAAHDLLHCDDAGVRRNTLILLQVCILKDEDSTSVANRLVYYRDIVENCQVSSPSRSEQNVSIDHPEIFSIDPLYSYFLDALRLVTHSGRNVHGFLHAQTGLAAFLANSLASMDSTKANSPGLTSLMDFISLVVEHNGPLLRENDVEPLLRETIHVATRAADPKTVFSALRIVQAMMVHAYIPPSCVDPVMEMLSGAYGVEAFTPLVREIFQGFASDSSAGTATLMALCHVLTRNLCGQGCNVNVCRGSIMALRDLFVPTVHTYENSLLYILKALSQLVSSTDSPVIHLEVSRLVNVLFDTPLDSFQYWYSSSGASIPDVLLAITILGTSEMTSKIAGELRPILATLKRLHQQKEYVGDSEQLLRLFMRFSVLPEDLQFVLDLVTSENYCFPGFPNWIQNCETVLRCFFHSPNQDVSIRVQTLDVLEQVYEVALSLDEDGTLFKALQAIMAGLLTKLTLETNPEVLQRMRKFLVNTGLCVPEQLFRDFAAMLCDCFQSLPLATRASHSAASRLLSPTTSALTPAQSQLTTVSQSDRRISLASIASLATFHSHHSAKEPGPKPLEPIFVMLAQTLAELFIVTITASASKAKTLYDALCQVSQVAIEALNLNVLMATARALLRIRCTWELSIFATNPKDMSGLATAFQRTTEDIEHPEEKQWLFPETIDYIPESHLDNVCKTLKLYDRNSAKLQVNSIDPEKMLDIVLRILETYIDWEIYSFTWAHFCPQLSNMLLFQNCPRQIIQLRAILCDQLQLKLPESLKLPSAMTKPLLQVALVRALTPLLAYNELFSKYDQDMIIQSLIAGLSSWEKTAIPCIDCLTVCCYELPMSVKKFINTILTKLQTKISSPYANAHILEFLYVLARSPALTSNFTVDDFKRVFGVTFKFIQFCHDSSRSMGLLDSAVKRTDKVLTDHGKDAEVEVLASTVATGMTPIFLQYLLASSYNVIAAWFLSMKLYERQELSAFIMKNLVLVSGPLEEELDEQNSSFLDFISRFTFSDIELRMTGTTAAYRCDKPTLLKGRWVSGISIISVETCVETGQATICIARPTGSSVFRFEIETSMQAQWVEEFKDLTVSPAVGGSPDEKQSQYTPDYISQQLFQHAGIPDDQLLPLPDDSATNRAISMLERVPVVQFHKVGVMYIAPRQSTEAEILGNQVGSENYQSFLSRMGTLIRTQHCKEVYMGGLDTEDSADGKYAYYWSDKITQMVFHATSLMPNNPDHDPLFSMKKRHIGNNYVNIFYDESGRNNFDFNVIRSQFNFIQIVITPHTLHDADVTHGSVSMLNILETQRSSKEHMHHSFKVNLYRRSGVPGVFSTCHFKLVSGDRLPEFVRNLALVASHFANVWHADNQKYTSNWCHRMRQIEDLRQKAGAHTVSRGSDAFSNYPSRTASINVKSSGQTNDGNLKTAITFLDQLSHFDRQ